MCYKSVSKDKIESLNYDYPVRKMHDIFKEKDSFKI